MQESLCHKKQMVYSHIFIESKLPMLIISPENGEIIDANPAAVEFYGYSIEALTGKHISQINQLSTEEVALEMRRAKEMQRNHFIFKHKLSSGKVRDVEVYSSPINVKREQYLLSVIHDITARIEAENQLKIYAKLFTSSNDMLAVIDKEQRYLAANDHYLMLFELSAKEIIGQRVHDVLDSESFHFSEPYIQKALKGTPVYYERQNCPLHKVSHLEVRYFPFTDIDNNLAGVIGVFRDITELKKNSERLSYLAHHDILTGLPNRLQLQEQLEQYVERSKRFGSHVYVLFIDLDRFKSVNDSMGHLVGDKLLIEVAKRLKSVTRSTDMVARVSGDEFVIVVEIREHSIQISNILRRIRESFNRAFSVNNRSIHITASIGVSQYPDDADLSSSLISNADSAMYRAKHQGRNQFAFFSKEESAALLRRSHIENALRGALGRNEFELYYQPQVHINDRSIQGMEVLLRWTHPELGSIPPAEFIPMAEQFGLMWDIGAWVLKDACITASEWKNKGLLFGKIAVNISCVQLRKSDFFDEIVSILEESNLPPSCLELEITESFVMSQAEEAIEQLRQLRALGVNIAVDDFGTGYSSLSYLKKLPLDRLKIDRTFVVDINDDEDSKTLALSIIALAKAMRLNVIAEGVESGEQAKCLFDNGCEFAQGFFYHKPLAPCEIEQLLS